MVVTTNVVRRLVTAAWALTAVAATSLVLAAPASADVPEGWPTNDSVETLHVLAVLVGIPLLLALVISVLVYLPSLLRGESVAPGGAAAEDQWLGGPRKAAGELAAPDAEDSAAGGAGARW